jgi:hypothetical protein
MEFKLELSKDFVKKFMEKHNCTKNEVIPILAASILEDKESAYYRELSGKFDIDAFLISKSLSELATLRSAALIK